MKILSLFLFLLPFIGLGQIAAWDFTGENALATSAPDLINPNLTGPSLLTRGANAAASAGSNSFRTVGFQNNGISTANLDYFQNTLQAAPGYTLSLSTINGQVAGTASFYATPGVSMQFAYSLNGTSFTLIGSPTVVTASGSFPQISVSGISALQNVPNGTTVTIRYYASGQTTTGGWGFNSPAAGANGLAFGGTVAPVSGCNTFSTISPSACMTYTVPSGNATYTTSGTYTDVIPNAALCDSTITINLTITAGTTYYADADADGFGNPLSSIVSCTPIAGYVTNGSDCDDNNNAIGAGTNTYYLDADGDGFGSTTSILGCTQPTGYVTNSLDCNDNNAAINPNAFDIPNNGIDEDCSGADATTPSSVQLGVYEFTAVSACPVIAVAVTAQPTNAVFSNYTTLGTTCSASANVFSNSAWNLGPNIDLNEYNQFSIQASPCFTMDLNRIIFTHRISGSGGTPTWILRSSLDNYASNLATGTPITTDKTDTINLSAAFDVVSQVTFRFYITNMAAAGATWRNDNVRLIGAITPLSTQTYYADADNDGFGNINSSIVSCNPPTGYVLNNTDCNDNNAAINPNTVWYEDMDGDNVGNTAVTFVGCVPPSSYVLAGGDCDDNNNTIGAALSYYIDNDNDGFGTGTAIVSCTDLGAGYATQAGDCNDSDVAINPNSPEICDGIDNNCNNLVDDGLVFVNYYVDADNDGFGTGAAMSMCEAPTSGYALVGGDCNDNNNTIYPGAIEIPNDGIDQNCDGVDGYLGINAINTKVLTVYPNPTTGILTINQEKSEILTIELIDLTGKIVFTTSVSDATNTIDISRFDAGSYFLNVQSENGIQRMTLVKR